MRRKHTGLVSVLVGLFLAATLLMSGCGQEEDLSGTVTQMLQATTPNFISLQGFEVGKRL